MSAEQRWRLDGHLMDLLTGLGAEIERVGAGAYVVTLRGSFLGGLRATAPVWLLAGERSVAVEAFVLHLIELADPGPAHSWLLRRNLGLRSTVFALDEVGDVFLTGSLPLAALDEQALDAVLGEIWSALAGAGPLLSRAYGARLDLEPGLRAKVSADGAGRRPAGTAEGAPRRDARR